MTDPWTRQLKKRNSIADRSTLSVQVPVGYSNLCLSWIAKEKVILFAEGSTLSTQVPEGYSSLCLSWTAKEKKFYC